MLSAMQFAAPSGVQILQGIILLMLGAVSVVAYTHYKTSELRKQRKRARPEVDPQPVTPPMGYAGYGQSQPDGFAYNTGPYDPYDDDDYQQSAYEPEIGQQVKEELTLSAVNDYLLAMQLWAAENQREAMLAPLAEAHAHLLTTASSVKCQSVLDSGDAHRSELSAQLFAVCQQADKYGFAKLSRGLHTLQGLLLRETDAEPETGEGPSFPKTADKDTNPVKV